MKKQYAETNGTMEFVYELEYFRERLIFEDIKSIALTEMKRDIGGPMWCTEEGEPAEHGCNWNCSYYSPCNGRSGRCRHLSNSFICTENRFILTKGGLKKEAPCRKG